MRVRAPDPKTTQPKRAQTKRVPQNCERPERLWIVKKVGRQRRDRESGWDTAREYQSVGQSQRPLAAKEQSATYPSNCKGCKEIKHKEGRPMAEVAQKKAMWRKQVGDQDVYGDQCVQGSHRAKRRDESPEGCPQQFSCSQRQGIAKGFSPKPELRRRGTRSLG